MNANCEVEWVTSVFTFLSHEDSLPNPPVQVNSSYEELQQLLNEKLIVFGGEEAVVTEVDCNQVVLRIDETHSYPISHDAFKELPAVQEILSNLKRCQRASDYVRPTDKQMATFKKFKSIDDMKCARISGFRFVNHDPRGSGLAYSFNISMAGARRGSKRFVSAEDAARAALAEIKKILAHFGSDPSETADQIPTPDAMVGRNSF